MKKLISIIVLLAMLMSAIIMAIPAMAEESDTDDFAATDPRSTHEWADYYWRYISGPFPSDEVLDEWKCVDFDGQPESVGTFDEIPDDYLSLIAEYINEEREHAIQTGDADPDVIISGEEFAERFNDSFEVGCLMRFIVRGDLYVIIRRYDGKFEIWRGNFIPIIDDADDLESTSAETETEPIETEPVESEPVETTPAATESAPVETDAAVGSGGNEPVTAPQTADRLALISGILVISLVLCAAVFTVVKEKSR